MLDDDLRHADRNEQARQRAADQLEPAMRRYMARFFEVDEDDLPRVRDAVKNVMRRQDQMKNSAWEVWKVALVGLGGAAVSWLLAHFSAGAGK